MERLTPTIDTVPPLAAQDSASTMVASAPTASMTDSAPRPPVASSTCPDPGAVRASMGSAPRRSARARRSGTTSTARIRAGPEERRALQRHDADRPEAHDDHGRSGPDVGALRSQVAGREDVGQQDSLFVGDTLGDGEREEVGERDGHGLGLPTREVGNGAEGRRLVVEAHVRLAGQARTADAAPDDARHEHAIAQLEAAHLRAGFGHRPDGLMAEPDPASGGCVVVQVQIGTTDRGALHRDDDALGPGEHGVGDVVDADRARSIEDGCSHSRTLPRGTRLPRADFAAVRPHVMPQILEPTTTDVARRGHRCLLRARGPLGGDRLERRRNDLPDGDPGLRRDLRSHGRAGRSAGLEDPRTGKAVAAVRPKDEAEAAVHALHRRGISATLARA